MCPLVAGTIDVWIETGGRNRRFCPRVGGERGIFDGEGQSMKRRVRRRSDHAASDQVAAARNSQGSLLDQRPECGGDPFRIVIAGLDLPCRHPFRESPIGDFGADGFAERVELAHLSLVQCLFVDRLEGIRLFASCCSRDRHGRRPWRQITAKSL